MDRPPFFLSRLLGMTSIDELAGAQPYPRGQTTGVHTEGKLVFGEHLQSSLALLLLLYLWVRKLRLRRLNNSHQMCLAPGPTGTSKSSLLTPWKLQTRRLDSSDSRLK